MAGDLYLRPLAADELLDRIAAFAADAFAGTKVTLSYVSNVPKVEGSFVTDGASIGKDETFTSIRRQFGERPYLQITRLTLQSRANPHPQVRYVCRDPLTAAFEMENFPDANQTLHVLGSLHKHFALTAAPDLVLDQLPEPWQKAIRIQESALRQLNADVARIGTFALQQTKANADHIREMTHDLQSKFQLRQTEMDEEYRAKHAALDSQHQARTQSVLEREEHLKRQQQEFDYRESTAVRRDLLGKIRAHLQEYKETRLSTSVRRKRWPIHLVCVVAIIGVGASFGFILREFLGTERTDWRYAGPLAFLAGTFATILWYYIRWNDQWFREHANAELATQRFMADILRASWLAELVFENKDRELPDTLLKQFATDLFRTTSRAGTKHPLDSAEDLLRRLTRLKVGPNAIEIEKEPKRIRLPDSSE